MFPDLSGRGHEGGERWARDVREKAWRLFVRYRSEPENWLEQWHDRRSWLEWLHPKNPAEA